MTLSRFIREHKEQIIVEFVVFAKTLMPGTRSRSGGVMTDDGGPLSKETER
jgi:hypothetical protein